MAPDIWKAIDLLTSPEINREIFLGALLTQGALKVLSDAEKVRAGETTLEALAKSMGCSKESVEIAGKEVDKHGSCDGLFDVTV